MASSPDPQPASTNSNPYDVLEYEPGASGKYCLKVQLPSGLVASERPSWIQLNSLNSPDFMYHTGDARLHAEGGSISNPAESVSPGMLAVGAAQHSVATPLHFPEIKKYNSVIKDYSSRGPLPASVVTKPESTEGIPRRYSDGE